MLPGTRIWNILKKFWYETLANIIYYVCLCLYKPRKKERLHMLSIGERAPVYVIDGVKSLNDTLVAGYEWNSWLVGRAGGVMSCARRKTEDAWPGLLSRADVITAAPLLIHPANCFARVSCSLAVVRVARISNLLSLCRALC